MWAILRDPQSFWQGYTAKCLPLSVIFEVRLKVGLIVVSGYFMCLPHGLRDLYLTRLGLLVLNVYGSGVIDILIESV